jgi:hypothetical protein
MTNLAAWTWKWGFGLLGLLFIAAVVVFALWFANSKTVEERGARWAKKEVRKRERGRDREQRKAMAETHREMRRVLGPAEYMKHLRRADDDRIAAGRNDGDDSDDL